MKWRFSSPPGHEGARILWALGGPRYRKRDGRRCRLLLYRVLPHLAGLMHVAGIRAKKCVSTAPGWRGWPYYKVPTYRTVYGARMAAEAAERKRRAS